MSAILGNNTLELLEHLSAITAPGQFPPEINAGDSTLTVSKTTDDGTARLDTAQGVSVSLNTDAGDGTVTTLGVADYNHNPYPNDDVTSGLMVVSLTIDGPVSKKPDQRQHRPTVSFPNTDAAVIHTHTPSLDTADSSLITYHK